MEHLLQCQMKLALFIYLVRCSISLVLMYLQVIYRRHKEHFCEKQQIETNGYFSDLSFSLEKRSLLAQNLCYVKNPDWF